MNIQVGDFVKGKPGSPYGITNEKMTRGLVTDVGENVIAVKIMEHEEISPGGALQVDPKYFEVIGHVKEFVHDEVIELLKTGHKKALLNYDLRGANLYEANLRGADLRGTDLDFSCLPLRCGGLKWKIDKRIAYQLAYHLCSMQCDDPEFLAMRNSILPFANQFHRVGECGRLEAITPEDE